METKREQNKKSTYRLKSLAKAAGVKSVFTVSDKLIMTGFGRGNDATFEKEVEADHTVLPLADPGSYDAAYQADRIRVTGTIKVKNQQTQQMEPIKASLPGSYAGRQDMLGLKDKLETRYFGRTFDDNIHVQIAHNIMDIEKLLTPFCNNIIYVLNALLRLPEERMSEDFFGDTSHFTAKNTYAELESGLPRHPWTKKEDLEKAFNSYWDFFDADNKQTERRLAYFGELFYEQASQKDPKTGKTKTVWQPKDDETTYDIFALLCDLRHFCTHGQGKDPHIKFFPYRLDTLLQPEAKETLDTLFEQKARSLGREAFVDSAGKSDVSILLRVFGLDRAPVEQQKALVKEFYDFKVQKTYKNLGFSVKKLREAMLELPEAAKYKDDRYSTVRHKLYGHLDFILTRHFLASLQEKELQNNRVFRALRACRSEEEKEQVYRDEAASVWPTVKAKTEKAFAEVVSIRDMSKEQKEAMTQRDKTLFDAIETMPTKVSLFSELIFMMSYLLDGKEINTLCTSLIHKFENIAGFNAVLADERVGMPAQYVNEYRFFADAGKIAAELRQVNNMARMGKPLGDVGTLLNMYNDAAVLLGASKEDEENLAYILNLDNHDLLVKPNGKKSPNKNFRNFIINNVVTSRRFLYLVRYGNPAGLRRVATSPAVIRFVLDQIPDEQIQKYYTPCTGRKPTEAGTMRAELAKILAAVNFRDFEDVDNRENVEKNATGQKARLQATVRLYLTVPYLFVKNMVNINARYVLAFHCLERDNGLYFDKNEKFDKQDMLALTRGFQQKRTEKMQTLVGKYKAEKAAYLAEKAAGRVSKKNVRCDALCRLRDQIAYTEVNIGNASSTQRIKYRNVVAHLGPVACLAKYVKDLPEGYVIDSYFAFYHYCLQRRVKDLAPVSEQDAKSNAVSATVAGYYAAIEATHRYSKNFLKALNVPFAYNIPRFKNLSIEALFDKNIVYEKAEVQKETEAFEANAEGKALAGV